jgi:NAD(P)H-nitrite reductase large subunit
MHHSDTHSKHVTILLSGGVIAANIMAKINKIAVKYNLTLYLTTAQNLRLLGATEENIDSIRKELLDQGLNLKAPGKFPKPKVCVGTPYCNLGVADTFSLAEKITTRFGDRTGVKPKYKIAISGCPACCGGSKIADIGIVATRNGFELYVGGKGGPLPRTGNRVANGLSEEEVVEAVGKLADFHAAKTPTKLRMFKLMAEEGFPFPSSS